MRNVKLAFLPCIVILAGAPACQPDNGQIPSAESEGGSLVLRRGNGGDPQTLDPARAEDVHAFNVLTDLYEGLVTTDAKGNIVAGVARSWTVSADGLTYTFRLDPDARWSNGVAVNAEDFVVAFRRALAPATASAYAFLLVPVENAAAVVNGKLAESSIGVFAPDARTLVIRLEEPAAHFLSVLAMPIAFPVWGGNTGDASAFANPEDFVGNGAYLLADWQPGHRIRLQRNPRYRLADDTHFDVVEFYALTDPLTELNMFRAGELDITATVPPAFVRSGGNDPDPALRIAPSLGVYYLAFDLTEPPFDNVQLRQALTMAIDRESLVSVIGRGEQAAYGFVPGSVAGYEPAQFEWRDMARAEREAVARSLLEVAGLATQPSLRVHLMYDAGDIHETIAVAVSAMWREVLGIETTLDKREWKYFLATRENRSDWEIMRFAWNGDYNHPATFAEILTSDSPQNLPGYASPEYDRLVAAAATSPDAGVQTRLLHTAEKTMLADYPVSPLYFYVSKHLVDPSITGFEDNALDRHPSRFLARTKPR